MNKSKQKINSNIIKIYIKIITTVSQLTIIKIVKFYYSNKLKLAK